MGLEVFEKAKMHFNHALNINPEMVEPGLIWVLLSIH